MQLRNETIEYTWSCGGHRHITDCLGQRIRPEQYNAILALCGLTTDDEYSLRPVVRPLTIGSRTFAPGCVAVVERIALGHHFWIVKGMGNALDA